MEGYLDPRGVDIFLTLANQALGFVAKVAKMVSLKFSSRKEQRIQFDPGSSSFYVSATPTEDLVRTEAPCRPGRNQKKLLSRQREVAIDGQRRRKTSLRRDTSASPKA